MGLLLTEQASYPVTAGRAGQFLPAENTVASRKQASKQSPTMGSMALAGTASAMGCGIPTVFWIYLQSLG